MNLGETIYRLRTQRNMSQGDLADALDVSRQSVSKWENNSAVPELEKLVKMSEIFGITLDELVGGKAAPTPPPAVPYVPERQPMPGRMIAGFILLGFAFAAFIAFTIAGYFMGDVLLGLVIALPLALNGTVCLVSKKNPGYFCCWGNYCLLFLLVFMVAMSPTGGIWPSTVSILSLILLCAMILWTLRRLHTGQLTAVRWKKIAVIAVLVICLIFHIYLILPTANRTVQEFQTDGDTYIHVI